MMEISDEKICGGNFSVKVCVLGRWKMGWPVEQSYLGGLLRPLKWLIMLPLESLTQAGIWTRPAITHGMKGFLRLAFWFATTKPHNPTIRDRCQGEGFIWWHNSELAHTHRQKNPTMTIREGRWYREKEPVFILLLEVGLVVLYWGGGVQSCQWSKAAHHHT